MTFVLRFCDQYWLVLTLVVLAGISVGSLMPLSEQGVLPGNDKTHHLVGYAGLVFFSALHRPRYWLCLVFAFALWSGAIELIQPYFNRYGEWRDLLANGVGLVIGIGLAQFARYWLRKSW